MLALRAVARRFAGTRCLSSSTYSGRNGAKDRWTTEKFDKYSKYWKSYDWRDPKKSKMLYLLCAGAIGYKKFNSKEEPKEQKKPVGRMNVMLGDIYNDKYHVIRKLGEGDYATVWLCWNSDARCFVAMKACNANAMKTGYNEMKAGHFGIFRLRRYNNFDEPLLSLMLRVIRETDRRDPFRERFVRAIDMFTIGYHTCIIFEDVGCDLNVFVRENENGLPLEKVRAITKQILEGLQYLHDKCQVIHTDMKLANVLLTMTQEEIQRHADNFVAAARHNTKDPPSLYDPDQDYSRAKITDLGSACCSFHHFTGNVQPRQFMPPEVLLQAECGTPADIWSVACIAYALATGHFLFTANGDEKDGRYSPEDELLAQFAEQLGGPIPASVYKKGALWEKYYDKNGKLIRIPVVQPYPLADMLTKGHGWPQEKAREFAAFLLPMLKVDQDERATAAQCLKHDWLKPNGGRPLDRLAAGDQKEESKERKSDKAEVVTEVSRFEVVPMNAEKYISLAEKKNPEPGEVKKASRFEVVTVNEEKYIEIGKKKNSETEEIKKVGLFEVAKPKKEEKVLVAAEEKKSTEAEAVKMDGGFVVPKPPQKEMKDVATDGKKSTEAEAVKIVGRFAVSKPVAMEEKKSSEAEPEKKIGRFAVTKALNEAKDVATDDKNSTEAEPVKIVGRFAVSKPVAIEEKKSSAAEPVKKIGRFAVTKVLKEAKDVATDDKKSTEAEPVKIVGRFAVSKPVAMEEKKGSEAKPVKKIGRFAVTKVLNEARDVATGDKNSTEAEPVERVGRFEVSKPRVAKAEDSGVDSCFSE